MNFNCLNESFENKYGLSINEEFDLENLFDCYMIDSYNEPDEQSYTFKLVFANPQDEDALKEALVAYFQADNSADISYDANDISRVELIAEDRSGVDYDHDESSVYGGIDIKYLDYMDDIIEDTDIIYELFANAFNISPEDLDEAVKASINQNTKDNMYNWEY